MKLCKFMIMLLFGIQKNCHIPTANEGGGEVNCEIVKGMRETEGDKACQVGAEEGDRELQCAVERGVSLSGFVHNHGEQARNK